MFQIQKLALYSVADACFNYFLRGEKETPGDTHTMDRAAGARVHI